MRERFTFHRHWLDGWEEMTDGERREYLEAIVRYGLAGKRGAMSRYVRGRMVTAMREMDEDAAREEAFREKQRRNIMKRWEKRDTKEYQPIPSGTKNTMVSSPYIKETRVPARRQAYSGGVSSSKYSEDTDNVVVVVADKGRTTCANDNDNNDLSSLVSQWNDAIKAAGSPMRPIRSLSPGTKRHTLALGLVKQYGEDGVSEAIAEAVKSEYINGHNSLGWVATFDWFVQPDNFQKVLEGNFAEMRTGKPLPSPSPPGEDGQPPAPARPEVGEEDRRGWRRLVEICRERIGGTFCSTYLDYCDIWSREGDTVTMACPSAFVAERIDKGKAREIVRAAREVWGKGTRMALTVQRGLPPPGRE